MEKISAACVMDWSMELEKALRSKKPCQAVKAIQEIGERLQLLSREPKPTMDVYNLFGLVPGEARVFANAILLRLADAFRLGDKDTRHCIVRVFFSELKNRDKQNKGKKYDGILSKDRVQNPMELLKRVKIVLDTGDVESRALALVLFGCWADFAKDSAHIRYLILSHLVSSEILEVKATLFTAGCFSALAADFAAVVLNMLLNIITSPESALAIRLAGTRVFSKMTCSYSIANRAHQIGAKLLLDSSDEDFSVAMLVSLSKLSAKTSLLSEQVNLLMLYLNQDKTLRLQATALRCLHFVLTRGVCPAPVGIHLTKLLLKFMDETGLPSAMQCEALKILQRMYLHELSTDMWTIVEKAAQSNVESKSLLAIRMLIDMSLRLGLRSDKEADGPCFSSLLSIFSILMERIISLLKPCLDVCENNAKFVHELHTLLGHFLLLVGESPDLGIYVLDKSRVFIEHLADLHDQNLTTREAGASADNLVEFGGQKGVNMALKLVNDIEKFSLTLIENLNEVGYITSEIIDKVKLLVESVHHCRLFGPYIHMKFSVLLQSQINLTNVLKQNEESSSVCEYFSYSTPLVQQLVEYEILSLELAAKMLRKRDHWDAYKAAIFAAYHGAWVTASYMFGQLIGKVQSDSFSCWLKALAKFAESEIKIQLFVMPNFAPSLLNLLQTREFHIQNLENNIDEIARGPNRSDIFIGVYNGLRSSEETLKSVPFLGNSFCFQRWVLASRAKLLRTVVDALEVLGCVLVGQGNVKSIFESSESLRRISEISTDFKDLADEFDLIAMSFFGMDIRSSKIISALALSCSLLAFTTAFGLSVLNCSDHETCGSALESSSSFVERIFVENLLERLRFIDQDTCSNLCVLLEANKQYKYQLISRNQILDFGSEVRGVLDICRHVVSTVVALRNEAKEAQNGEILSRIANDGVQLLSKAITKWMRIPFRIPKHFFRVRRCISPELFAYSADARNLGDLTVLPGFHLSLNLGLQLHNLPPDLKIKKFYCIVCSSKSFQEPQSQGNEKRVMEVPDMSMVAMNKKLLHHVTQEQSKHCNHSCSVSDDEIVCSFARFEVNERGSGFSSCLLNMSNFSVGCYRIKWHTCFVDNQGRYWSLIPQNAGPFFTVRE